MYDNWRLIVSRRFISCIYRSSLSKSCRVISCRRIVYRTEVIPSSYFVRQFGAACLKRYSSSTWKRNVMEKRVFERLPKNVIPKHYDLTLKPNFDKFTFEGTETINVEVM